MVRAVSAAHVVLAVVMVALLGSGPAYLDVAVVLMWFLLFDLVIMTATGTSPLSPIGVLCTYACWNYRGPSVSTLPYKVNENEGRRGRGRGRG